MKPTPVNIDKNDTFNRAFDLMQHTTKSLFITGKAGTGKSTLLDYFCLHTDKNPVILAPTGVAALNVKGQTIHRFFNFYVDVTVEKIEKKQVKPRNAKLYKQIKTIIIDEVSMVRADLLDCIDTFLKMYGPIAGLPFGGVQMVFVGDLYQLPPVVSQMEQSVFNTHYDSPYFFSARAMEGYEIEKIELEKVYRQKDPEFVGLLNRIRNNTLQSGDLDHLNTRVMPDPDMADKTGDFTIYLTTTNARADEINETHLAALPGKTYIAKAEVSGDFTKEYYPTAPDLAFKTGAQIMLLNNDAKKRWVNGSIGVIEHVKTDDEGHEYLKVRLQDTSESVNVYPFMWEVFKFKLDSGAIVSEAAGTFSQYPFRLAWAVTIHKSQGKTFNRAVIDMGRGAFASGQTYVALSRCTSFEGMRLRTKINARDIRTDAAVHAFMTGGAVPEKPQRISVQTDSVTDEKLALIRAAIADKANVSMTYEKPDGTTSSRVVRPIGVGAEEHKGQAYVGLHAFCTLRNEDRLFRVDRIIKVERVG